MRITVQQDRILKLLVKGLTSKEIGKILKIRGDTVERHIQILRYSYGVTRHDLIELYKNCDCVEIKPAKRVKNGKDS